MADDPRFTSLQDELATETQKCRKLLHDLHTKAGQLRGGLENAIKGATAEKASLEPLLETAKGYEKGYESAAAALPTVQSTTTGGSGAAGGKSFPPGLTATGIGLVCVLIGFGVWALLLENTSPEPVYDAKTVLAIAAFGVAASAYLASAARDVRKALGSETDEPKRQRHRNDLFWIDVADTIAICLIVVSIGRLLGPYLPWGFVRDNGESDLLLTVLCLITVAAGVVLHLVQRLVPRPRT